MQIAALAYIIILTIENTSVFGRFDGVCLRCGIVGNDGSCYSFIYGGLLRISYFLGFTLGPLTSGK
jgi:hypothetical protein